MQDMCMFISLCEISKVIAFLHALINMGRTELFPFYIDFGSFAATEIISNDSFYWKEAFQMQKCVHI